MASKKLNIDGLKAEKGKEFQGKVTEVKKEVPLDIPVTNPVPVPTFEEIKSEAAKDKRFEAILSENLDVRTVKEEAKGTEQVVISVPQGGEEPLVAENPGQILQNAETPATEPAAPPAEETPVEPTPNAENKPENAPNA